MNRYVHHHRQIERITSDALFYKNEQGCQQRIDFEACRNGWVDFVNRSEEFAVTDLKPEQTRTVAWRDITDEPAYIEFFTEPRTRFIFPYKRTLLEWMLPMYSSKKYRYFSEISNAIARRGWQTFDLS